MPESLEALALKCVLSSLSGIAQLVSLPVTLTSVEPYWLRSASSKTAWQDGCNNPIEVKASKMPMDLRPVLSGLS